MNLKRQLWLVILFCPALCRGWGFYGHTQINRLAVFCLPPQLFGFYKQHIDYLGLHAVDADKRRYALADEACRHYLDCDRYEHQAPLDTLPMWWNNAVQKYGEDTLKAHGIVPWHCNFMLYRLTDAFKEKDLARILKISADLGHYIADAHVPLHACGNYNGQRTNQHGIHGLWESRIPELYLKDYDLLTGTSPYLDKPMQSIWRVVEQSFAASDTVLKTELEISRLFPGDAKYTFETRGTQLVRVYAPEFCSAYDAGMQGMVERRFRQSVSMVAAFWFTAWVNAGQPDLPIGEVNFPLSEEELLLEQKFKDGQILGRPEEH